MSDFFTGLLDSHSAMSRLRSKTGFRISSGSRVSSHIHKSKIMRTLRRGLKGQLRIGNRVEKNIERLLDRIETRLDKMPTWCLEYIFKEILQELSTEDAARYVYKTKIESIMVDGAEYNTNKSIEDNF